MFSSLKIKKLVFIIKLSNIINIKLLIPPEIKKVNNPLKTTPYEKILY